MINIVVVNEVLIGAITAVLGTTAIAYTSRARMRLSAGTLKNYVSYFLVCLLFLVGFSILRIAREVLGLEPEIIFIEYGFIGMAYVVFAITSQKMYTMSLEFGFNEKTDKIKEAMRQNMKRQNKTIGDTMIKSIKPKK